MSSSLHITTSPQKPKLASPASPIVASPYKLATSAKKMSVTQAYFLAHKARAKLSHQASRPDHNLRLLVGHANLLDSLMLELADAEREQESWFNQSVRGASVHHDEKIEYEDTIIEEPEEWDEDDSEDSSEDEDMDEEDIVMANTVSLRRILPASAPRKPLPQHQPHFYNNVKSNSNHFNNESAIEDDDEEGDEDFAQLGLVRTPSHPNSPPELDDDSESSEDEVMPPSPPTQTLTFTEKDLKEAQETASFYSEGFYLPPRNPARLEAAAVSVY